MKGAAVLKQLSQVLQPLMWPMTPLLAPPTKPQRTHPRFGGGTSVNMEQLGGELPGRG